MGNICDCFKGSTAEPAYSPIETVEVVQPQKPRAVERPANNYQTILESASGNFISSKYRSRSEGVAISNSSENAEVVRSRFMNVQVNPQVVCSPPTTGIVVQSYSTFSAPTSNGTTGAAKDDRNGASSRSSAVSALHTKPQYDAALESSADGLAQLMRKQAERSVDRFSSNPNDYSAVAGFKPLDALATNR